MISNIPKELKRGVITENPIFVLALGLCPALGVSSSVVNGLGMGLATTFVLIASNLIIAMIKKAIPAQVRIPSFIIVIATFVTIVQMVMKAYLPGLNDQLGIFIPLIVVNCLILGRAEAYASQHSPINSVIDGFAMGIGFTAGLLILSTIREVLGANQFLGLTLIPGVEPISIFTLAPGGFLTIGFVIAGLNYLKIKKERT
ncbi:MAG: electron transport complex subunit RsxE [Fibrobacterota bacterium]